MKKSRTAAPLPALIGGITALTSALLTRLTAGSPLAVIHKLAASGALPPLWLLSLLWLASFALLGGMAGLLLASPHTTPQREVCLWRGGTFMVLAMVFSLGWYTLLFGKLCLLPSCLCLLLSAAAAGICAVSWMQIKKSATAVALAFSLWQISLFFLQCTVLLYT